MMTAVPSLVSVSSPFTELPGAETSVAFAVVRGGAAVRVAGVLAAGLAGAGAGVAALQMATGINSASARVFMGCVLCCGIVLQHEHARRPVPRQSTWVRCRCSRVLTGHD